MAIRRIEKIYCSLNLGLIYNVNYSYSPEAGVAISIFFVSEDGNYQPPQLLPMQKANIRIGNASFSMYPVRYRLESGPKRRVLRVDFVDEMRELDNYKVVLTGRGCGDGVYQLGTPVDNRTLQQKQAASLNPVTEQIKDFTQFPDLEYTFNDFLAVLRQKFNVVVNAQFNAIITNDFVGTFREVLEQWCSFFNLSYFFENGQIKIFDPTKLTINLPNKPTDAIEYNVEEDIGETYAMTVANYFQQNGGEKSLSQANSSSGDLLIRNVTLFPVGYEFNLPQTTLNLSQVVAAMYGQEFWFLYNRYLGSTSEECGWSPVGVPIAVSATLAKLGAGAAAVDYTKYNDKFQAYRGYGDNIAGRWYLSNEISDISIEQGFQWFDEVSGQIFDFTHVTDRQITPEYLQPASSDIQALPETVINSYFPGVNYVGNRMVYKDNKKIDFATEFALDDNIKALIATSFQAAFSIPGSESVPFPLDKKYTAYSLNYSTPSALSAIFATVSSKIGLFSPRFTSFPIVGITREDYTNLKSTQNEPQGVEIITTSGPSVVSNTGVIKTIKNGSYTVYYDKYQQCASSSNVGGLFKRKFNIRQISDDSQITFSFVKTAKNSYRITRNLGIINALVNNPILPQLAQPRTFSTKKVSFSLNYFYDIPVNFLTNGLVAMNISVGDSEISSSYMFSNEVLRVPDFTNKFELVESQIRNSWIRSYRPNETIS